MGVCQEHWAELRLRLIDAGLGAHIPDDGAEAGRRQVDQLERSASQEDSVTVDNFDPLMGAFWAVVNNAAEILSMAGGSPLYVMADGDEDPIDFITRARLKKVYEQEVSLPDIPRTWPRCAPCYADIHHALTCKDLRCTLPKVNGVSPRYLGYAVRDQVGRARELGLPVTPPSP